MLPCQLGHAPLFWRIRWLILALLSMLHAEYVDNTKDKIKGLEDKIARHEGQQEAIERRAADLSIAQDAVREEREEQRRKDEALAAEKKKLVQDQQALEEAQGTLAQGQERLQVGGRSCCLCDGVLSCTLHGLGLHVHTC